MSTTATADKQYLRIGEVSAEFGTPVETLRYLVASGKLPAKRLIDRRGHWRFLRRDLPTIRRILEQAGLVAPQEVREESNSEREPVPA